MYTRLLFTLLAALTATVRGWGFVTDIGNNINNNVVGPATGIAHDAADGIADGYDTVEDFARRLISFDNALGDIGGAVRSAIEPLFDEIKGATDVILDELLPLKEITVWKDALTLGYPDNSYNGETIDIGMDATHSAFEASDHQIFRRECSTCEDMYKNVYYRRFTDYGAFSYSYLREWKSLDNQNNVDFKLYSSMNDALSDQNAWTSCGYDVDGIGFPGNCGPSGLAGLAVGMMMKQVVGPIFEDVLTLGPNAQDVFGQTIDIGQDAFNYKFASAFSDSERGFPVIKRECPECADTHKLIFYKRKTAIGDFNAYQQMASWYSVNNNMANGDFALYSSWNDLLFDQNAWTYCNYDDTGVGFPRDCGPNGAVGSQWTSSTRGGQRTKFSIWAGTSKPTVLFGDQWSGDNVGKPSKFSILMTFMETSNPFFDAINPLTNGVASTVSSNINSASTATIDALTTFIDENVAAPVDLLTEESSKIIADTSVIKNEIDGIATQVTEMEDDLMAIAAELEKLPEHVLALLNVFPFDLVNTVTDEVKNLMSTLKNTVTSLSPLNSFQGLADKMNPMSSLPVDLSAVTDIIHNAEDLAYLLIAIPLSANADTVALIEHVAGQVDVVLDAAETFFAGLGTRRRMQDKKDSSQSTQRRLVETGCNKDIDGTFCIPATFVWPIDASGSGDYDRSINAWPDLITDVRQSLDLNKQALYKELQLSFRQINVILEPICNVINTPEDDLCDTAALVCYVINAMFTVPDAILGHALDIAAMHEEEIMESQVEVILSNSEALLQNQLALRDMITTRRRLIDDEAKNDHAFDDKPNDRIKIELSIDEIIVRVSVFASLFVFVGLLFGLLIGYCVWKKDDTINQVMKKIINQEEFNQLR